MLNKRKRRNFFDTKSKVKSDLFQIPQLAKNTYIQTSAPQDLNFGFNNIFTTDNQKQTTIGLSTTRFEYVSKQFKDFHIHQSFKRSLVNKPVIDFKTFIIFLHRALRKKKRLPFFFLKQIKGGFMVSALGSICFVPQSLFKSNLRQQLINLKVYQKRTRKFTKPLLKINVVSSLKLKKA